MSTIKDGAYKFWLQRQPNLMPLDAMRDVENELRLCKPGRILEVGLDLTVIAVLAYAKEAGVPVDVVLPRHAGLTKELRRIGGQLGLDLSGVVEAPQSVRGWPVALPGAVVDDDEGYDFVRLMGYGSADPSHRQGIVEQVEPLLTDGAVVCIYPCTSNEETQLLEDFSVHNDTFDVQRRGSVVFLRTGPTETKPPLTSEDEPDVDPTAPQPQTLQQDAPSQPTEPDSGSTDVGASEVGDDQPPLTDPAEPESPGPDDEETGEIEDTGEEVDHEEEEVEVGTEDEETADDDIADEAPSEPDEEQRPPGSF